MLIKGGETMLNIDASGVAMFNAGAKWSKGV